MLAVRQLPSFRLTVCPLLPQAEVPSDKPRLLHGPWRPLHVLRLIESGVDGFDSSYPSLAADRGAALVFPLVPPAAARWGAGRRRRQSMLVAV